MSSGISAMRNAVDAGFEVMMGADADDKVRKVAIAAAVIGFASHLLLWALHNSGQLTIEGDSMELVKSPLSALYTPFSILLAYEVYQLIRTIPESFSSSVGKQYEIATLLVVRDILKRLSDVNSSEGWEISSDVGFLLVECAAFLALFYTSLAYHNMKKGVDDSATLSEEVSIFILTKKATANLMLVVFAVIALSSCAVTVEGLASPGAGASATYGPGEVCPAR